MSFNHGLNPGDTVDNKKLTGIFGCSPQGGMRRSHKTNTLLIISDHIKSVYEDRWVDDTFHYTGMGLEGDQSLYFNQNNTLAQSDTNGVSVYLFEVFESGRYTYQGKVKLNGKPYQEVQTDKNNAPRQVWIFPLKLINTQPAISESMLRKKEETQQKKIRRLSSAELTKRASLSSRKAGTRNVTSELYERNQYVSELAKRNAKGICQLCKKPAPFNNKKGEPFINRSSL